MKSQLESLEKSVETKAVAPPTNASAEIETGKSVDNDDHGKVSANNAELESLKMKVAALEELVNSEKEKNSVIVKEAEEKIKSIKSEASSKMKEVVQKKTQKVMGHVYKQISNEFKESKGVHGDVILQKVKDIIKDTTMKLFS